MGFNAEELSCPALKDPLLQSQRCGRLSDQAFALQHDSPRGFWFLIEQLHHMDPTTIRFVGSYRVTEAKFAPLVPIHLFFSLQELNVIYVYSVLTQWGMKISAGIKEQKAKWKKLWLKQHWIKWGRYRLSLICSSQVDCDFNIHTHGLIPPFLDWYQVMNRWYQRSEVCEKSQEWGYVGLFFF